MPVRSIRNADEIQLAPGSPMPIHIVEIALDEMDYPGWVVAMRTNPPAGVYDQFCKPDQEQYWDAMRKLVLQWNLQTEEGTPIPLPRDGTEPTEVPNGILNYLATKYIKAFQERSAVPKEPSESSETT